MSSQKVQFYRTLLGARETPVGRTCSDCCRYIEYQGTANGEPSAHGRCGVTLGPITRLHTACILFPLVNGWTALESSSSSLSDE